MLNLVTSLLLCIVCLGFIVFVDLTLVKFLFMQGSSAAFEMGIGLSIASVLLAVVLLAHMWDEFNTFILKRYKK